MLRFSFHCFHIEIRRRHKWRDMSLWSPKGNRLLSHLIDALKDNCRFHMRVGFEAGIILT